MRAERGADASGSPCRLVANSIGDLGKNCHELYIFWIAINDLGT
jgi:hypothetical protein